MFDADVIELRTGHRAVFFEGFLDDMLLGTGIVDAVDHAVVPGGDGCDGRWRGQLLEGFFRGGDVLKLFRDQSLPDRDGILSALDRGFVSLPFFGDDAMKLFDLFEGGVEGDDGRTILARHGRRSEES